MKSSSTRSPGRWSGQHVMCVTYTYHVCDMCTAGKCRCYKCKCYLQKQKANYWLWG